MTVATWAGYPAHYGRGRERAPQYVVIHYTAGAEGRTAAEDGAAYDKRRADPVSTHCFADANSVVRELPDTDTAYAAFPHGNAIGLHLEICGTIQTRAQWLDETSIATLRMAAAQVAEWCAAYGFPARRLSVAEVRAAYYAPEGQRPSGICGHVDVTQAYPEDGGDHTDPGPEFPWDVLLDLIAQALGGQSSTVEGSDMATIVLNVEDNKYYAVGADGIPRRLKMAPGVGINDVGFVLSGKYRPGGKTGPARPGVLCSNAVIDAEPHIDIPAIPLSVVAVAQEPTTAPTPVDVAALVKALIASPDLAKLLRTEAFAGAQDAEKE